MMLTEAPALESEQIFTGNGLRAVSFTTQSKHSQANGGLHLLSPGVGARDGKACDVPGVAGGREQALDSLGRSQRRQAESWYGEHF